MGKSAASLLQQVAQQSKADRRNHAQQKRDAKRQELLRKKRGMMWTDGVPTATAAPPRVVGIVTLNDNMDLEEWMCQHIIQGADRVVRTHRESNATITCKFDVHKKDGTLTLLTSRLAFAHHGDGEDAAVLAALDLARVCDLLLFVIDASGPRPDDAIMEINIGDETSIETGRTSQSTKFDSLISQRGDRILSAIKGQGIPTPLTVLAHTEKDTIGEDQVTMQSMKSLRRSRVKRQLDLRKFVSRFATTEFGTGNDKVIEVDLSAHVNKDSGTAMTDSTATTQDLHPSAAALVRMICSMSASPANWVAHAARPYILSDTYKFDEDTSELSITGFVRGTVPFDVNSLVHVPGLGTYACKFIAKETPPTARTSCLADKNDTLFSDPEMRESIDMLATPHALDGEQNLIGFEETSENEDDDPGSGKGEEFARPAGWSDYQSAWLDAIDDVDDEDVDRGELATALNEKADTRSHGGDLMDLDDANAISAQERSQLVELRKKEQREHDEFPDEVQVDEEVKARERFARYRSLKSFRKSVWDPKESLPESYASIYHFSSFKATQKSVMNDMKEVVRAADAIKCPFWGCTPHAADEMSDDDSDGDILEGFVPVGSYVTLTIEGVPTSAISLINPDAIIAAVALLEHENKMSVLHMGLSQSTNCDVNDNVPVKSKDLLTFRCGWRTWQGRPVFSQHNLNCDKHKFERFMPQRGAFFAASIFGPVTYTPCPVLVFRERSENIHQRELIAVGSMIGADADRIIVKRIILTGYPVRVHKRYATVKYMFYNPDDVKWFKPAGLYTKHGLQGNILESVGEHGTMKCLFNAPIKQHDTVCLPLYKRVYPKFPVSANEGDIVRSSRNLLVT